MGAGLARQLGEIVKPICGENILFVTDPGMVANGLVGPVVNTLRAAGLRVTIFDQVQADPPEAIILQAADMARHVSGVVGFGGGSSLDVAKLAALLAASGQPLAEAYGIGNAKGPRLPLVLVPTTSGTGSEVTPISIVINVSMFITMLCVSLSKCNSLFCAYNVCVSYMYIFFISYLFYIVINSFSFCTVLITLNA